MFQRDQYERIAAPAFREFKLRHFGDKRVILHEREISRGDGAFRRLHGAAHRHQARVELRALLASLPFSIVAVGLDKRRFAASTPAADSPYERRFIDALLACTLAEPDIADSTVPTEIVADSRGRREDAQLSELIATFSALDAPVAADFHFQVRFAKKGDMEVGVETADLIANPIAQHILGAEHSLIPFHLLQPEFLRHPQDPSRLALIVLDRD